MTHSSEPRILIVDDDAATRVMVERVLQRERFQVDCASDGQEAIEMLTRTEYGTILLDLMMPRVDGIGVLRFLEATRPGSGRRVIVMTANLRSEELDECTSPAFSVLSKPFDIELLVDQVNRCVAQTASAAN